MRSKTKTTKTLIRALSISIAPIALAMGGFHNASAQDLRPGVAYQNAASPTQAALKSLLSSRADTTADSAGRNALESFYASRDFAPVWTGSAEATQAAGLVRAALMDADKQGLDSALYTSALPANDSPSSGEDAARYDLAMTDALLRYAHDVRVGRVGPNDIQKDVDLPKSTFDASKSLSAAVANGSSIAAYLADLPPPYAEYRRLGEALARYRAIAAQGGWTTAANDGKGLLARLALEDPTIKGAQTSSDEALRNAIKRYQKRNGLKEDGNIGSETAASLNVPVSARIQQIVANMERWRWMPRQMERRYISINVPDQNLEFMLDGKVIFTSRVIIGKQSTPTPILRTTAEAVVANPPWNVPADIAVRQFLPQLKRDPNYLAAHNMVVVNGPAGDTRGATIPWDTVSSDPSSFPYHIRQLPSSTSAMGLLMIDAPNGFDVYLHDTPGKHFFEADQREISNGCVRVQDMMPLASMALTESPSAGLEQVKQAIASHETRRIALNDPLPIYMLYWTAIADADGNIGFRRDPYNRNAPLISALGNTRGATRS